MRERIEITFDPQTVFAESDLPEPREGDLFHYLRNELDAHGIITSMSGAKGCAPAPEPEIYVFVRGGVVQGVRSTKPAAVHVIDYDNMETGSTMFDNSTLFDSEEEFERATCGKTFAEIEQSTEGIF